MPKLCDDCGHPLPNAAGSGLYCTNCGTPVHKPARPVHKPARDHEHCVEIGQCWQDREPCPELERGGKR